MCREQKVYINDPGHMNKMAAMLKDALHLKKKGTTKPIALKLGM